MIPNTGSWAKFTFINKLASLDGIYQITSMESFQTAINRGVDFKSLLYSPAGLGDTDWQTDYANYTNDDVYWLQPTDNTKSQIPVPRSALAKLPDINVGSYIPLMLRVDVGLYKSPDELQYLADQISDIVSATTGETSSVIWTSRQSGTVYMTDDDYKALDTARKAKAQQLTPLITQVYQKDKIIDDQKSQIQYLQKALIEALNKKS